MEMCQSCGMPLKQDPQGGGTNADGSKNKESPEQAPGY
jgi:hypothetical protein